MEEICAYDVILCLLFYFHLKSFRLEATRGGRDASCFRVSYIIDNVHIRCNISMSNSLLSSAHSFREL